MGQYLNILDRTVANTKSSSVLPVADHADRASTRLEHHEERWGQTPPDAPMARAPSPTLTEAESELIRTAVEHQGRRVCEWVNQRADQYDSRALTHCTETASLMACMDLLRWQLKRHLPDNHTPDKDEAPLELLNLLASHFYSNPVETG